MISETKRRRKTVRSVNTEKGSFIECCSWLGDPVILKESPGTALVDGQNLLGPYVGKFCMNLAMEKAKKIGIGLVAARRSNHFGIAGYYSLKAVDNDLIGWAVSLFIIT